MAVPPTPKKNTRVTLLGKAEKAQLEELILSRLHAWHDEKGAGSLLVDGLRVVVTVSGAHIDHGETADPLASVPVRSLFTALCYVSAGTPGMPRDALGTLATEATSTLAAQLNRIGGG